MVSPPLKVSVVMAVYNERPYLDKAVQSVLDQTFDDFEFIIVNDGSTDGSTKVLDRFEQRDDRIRLVHQENRGLIASLNRGIDMAEGEYIARMDGDDVSHPERFERQVSFLEDNAEIGILGTQADKINAKGNVREGWKRSLPTDSDDATWRLLFNSCFCHPTIMMRHSVVENLGGYAEWAEVAEDYELFSRAVLETQLANLPDTMLKHRRHEGSVAVSKLKKNISQCAEVAARLHHAILGPSSDDGTARFLVWMERKGLEVAVEETGMRDFDRVHDHLRSLYKACTRRFFADKSNTRVQRRALRKLDTVANQLTEAEGAVEGMLYKLRSWSILSFSEVGPLMWKVFRSRIFR